MPIVHGPIVMACSCRSSAYAAAEVATGTTKERLPGVRIILSLGPRSMVSRGRVAASVLMGGRGRGTGTPLDWTIAVGMGIATAAAFFAASAAISVVSRMFHWQIL